MNLHVVGDETLKRSFLVSSCTSVTLVRFFRRPYQLTYITTAADTRTRCSAAFFKRYSPLNLRGKCANNNFVVDSLAYTSLMFLFYVVYVLLRKKSTNDAF